jgi:hypothetical protein
LSCHYTLRLKQKEEIIIGLAGDVFLNFALLALAEVPGYALSYLGMTWFGRKVPSASNWKVRSGSNWKGTIRIKLLIFMRSNKHHVTVCLRIF